MTAERESTEERDETDQFDDAASAASSARLTGRAKAWATLITVALVIWFFVAWLAMGQNVVDAAGESVGTALVLLLLVSIVSEIRQRGR